MLRKLCTFITFLVEFYALVVFLNAFYHCIVYYYLSGNFSVQTIKMKWMWLHKIKQQKFSVIYLFYEIKCSNGWMKNRVPGSGRGCFICLFALFQIALFYKFIAFFLCIDDFIHWTKPRSIVSCLSNLVWNFSVRNVCLKKYLKIHQFHLYLLERVFVFFSRRSAR